MRIIFFRKEQPAVPVFIMLTRVAAEALRSRHVQENLQSKGDAAWSRGAP